jgi:hypothetical protein
MKTIMQPNWKTLALALSVAGGALAGCGGTEPEDGIETKTANVVISPSGRTPGQQAEYGTMWVPSMGGGVSLNSGMGTTCFLNAVWGKFASLNDYVQIGWNGSTYTLYGQASTGSSSPSADAFCQQKSAVSSGSWSAGQPSVSLGSSANRSCYLTGLSGNFNGFSSEVRIHDVNGTWMLDGTGSVAGSAICVSATPYGPNTFTASNSNPAPIMKGSNNQTLPGAVNFSPASGYFCALTGVKGYLANQAWTGAYLLSVDNSAGTYVWNWHLGGKVTGGGIFGGLQPLTGTGYCNL